MKCPQKLTTLFLCTGLDITISKGGCKYDMAENCVNRIFQWHKTTPAKTVSSPEKKNASIHKHILKFFASVARRAKELPVYFTRLVHEKLRLRMQLLLLLVLVWFGYRIEFLVLVVRTTFFQFLLNSSTPPRSFVFDSTNWIFSS